MARLTKFSLVNLAFKAEASQYELVTDLTVKRSGVEVPPHTPGLDSEGLTGRQKLALGARQVLF